jgi:sulfur carrier protein ThiS adenylyltransferase
LNIELKNLSPFEQGVAAHIGLEALRRIQTVRIGIGGAGGLGSNCAANLVRCGFSRLTLADHDTVEWSNLNRQFFFGHQIGQPKVDALRQNLLAINPGLEITTTTQAVTPDNVHDCFSACDVVVEAFDRAEDKKMIVEAYINSGKLLVSASGLAGWGESDAIRVHHVKPNVYLVGDLTTAVGDQSPPLSPRVAIAAAKQADIVLAYVLGDYTDERRRP